MTVTEAVARAIAKMRFGGLSDYGRLPSDASNMALVIETYVDAISDAEPGEDAFLRNIGVPEIAEATRRLIRAGGDFPTAGRFRQECLVVWEHRWRLAGIEMTDGSLAIVPVPRDDPDRAERMLAATRDSFPMALPPDTSPLVEGRPALPAPRSMPLALSGENLR